MFCRHFCLHYILSTPLFGETTYTNVHTYTEPKFKRSKVAENGLKRPVLSVYMYIFNII